MRRQLAAATLLALWAGLFIASSHAGDPHSAYYHWSANRDFRFMVISDIHVGDSDDQDTTYLAWAVNEARAVIDPAFIVASGDLTDSTNGTALGILFGPYVQEWQAYRDILLDAGMTESFFYDIPGNHDHYNDPDFDYYLTYSIQGAATGNTQHVWTRSYPFGTYRFIGTCTAGNDGAGWSPFPGDNYGDHAGLDADELGFIEAALAAPQPDSGLTLIFGHHPFEAGYYDPVLDTGLTYGRPELLSLIDAYGVSAYTFGHTHNYRENVYYSGLSEGVFYLNLSSLGKADSDHFAVVAVDGDGVSVVSGQKGVWPVVSITAPVDHDLGDLSQPFAYDIPRGTANPIRALVFDPGAVTSVEFRIDGGDSWLPMQAVGGGPVFQGFWDASTADEGFHTVEVRAQGSAIVTHSVTTYVNPAACMGDSDRDGDVDGSNLAAFIGDFVSQTTADLAGAFGKTGCVR